jgi:membrane protein
LALVAGVVALLAGATTVFVQLQDALNRIWDVEARPHSSAVWSFVRQRLVSLAMVVGTGFLLLVSLVVSAVLAALGEWAGASLVEAPWVLRVIDTSTSLIGITVLLALIFKVLPDAKVPWRAAWVGGFVASVMFTGGKYLIGLYLGRAAIGSAYGAASSLVVLMVWVFYASLIVLLGSELAHVWSGHGRAGPKPHAVSIEPSRLHPKTRD